MLLLLQAKSHLYLTFVAKSFQPEESYLVFANVLQTDNFFHNFFDKMLLSECSGSRFQICTQLALEADRMLCVILPCRIFCCGPTKLQWAVVVASRTHTIKSEAILSLFPRVILLLLRCLRVPCLILTRERQILVSSREALRKFQVDS